MKKMKLLVAAISGTLLPATASFVQAAALEEVIVTAQKRTESLQDTPIAITAFTARDLQNKGLDNISQIASFTPNMTFDTTAAISGSSSAAVVFLRGVGQTNFQVTNDPGVGTYIDGVYMSSSIGGVMDIIDVERIEVLRGPQGTLFGRNTIGGAINITSVPPSNEAGGSAEMTMGNYNRVNVRASMDIPLTDNLLSKWSVGTKSADGYMKVKSQTRATESSNGNFSDGLNRNNTDLGDDGEAAARISFLYTPTDDLSISLSADMSKIREASAASSLVGVQAPDEGSLGVLTGLYNTFDAPNIDVPGLGTGILYDERWVSDNPESETFKTGPNGTDVDVFGVSGTVKWSLNDSLILKSITAYRETDAEFNRDPDGSPLQFAHTYNDYEHEQFSQEFQFLGDVDDGAIQWIAGLYYFEETATDSLVAPLAPFYGTVVLDADVENDSFAIFGQSTWNLLSDRMSVTLGARYTKDTRDMMPDFRFDLLAGGVGVGLGYPDEEGNPTNIIIPNEKVSDTFEEITTRFAIDYAWTDELLTYFSYSEGYKSGGFNSRTLAARPEALSFEPETLKTYEIGAKWQGFDDTLRLNAAMFYSDYEDIGVTVIENIAPGTQTGGAAEIKGVELELVAVPTDNLQINWALGYLDTKYVELAELTEGVAPISQIPEDAVLVNSPELTSTLAIEYTIPLDTGELVVRADWTFTDEVYNDDYNSEILKAPSNNIYNAQIAYEKEEWQFTLWGKNLSDERFVTGGDTNFIIGFLEANFNEPRTYGVTLRRGF